MWTPSPCLLLQTPTGKATGFFLIVLQFTEKSAEHMLGGRPFLFSSTILSMGWCWFGSWWPSALWGPGLPSIQRSLDGLFSGQCKFFVSVPWYFVTWGSNKSESVISSSSVPWTSGVSIHFCIWFQFHTSGETYLLTFLGYIYEPRLGIEKQSTLFQTFCILSIVPIFP